MRAAGGNDSTETAARTGLGRMRVCSTGRSKGRIGRVLLVAVLAVQAAFVGAVLDGVPAAEAATYRPGTVQFGYVECSPYLGDPGLYVSSVVTGRVPGVPQASQRAELRYRALYWDGSQWVWARQWTNWRRPSRGGIWGVFRNGGANSYHWEESRVYVQVRWISRESGRVIARALRAAPDGSYHYSLDHFFGLGTPTDWCYA